MDLMKATISLKQLRNDPREYVRLLNSGYEVEITEHRRTIAKAVQPKSKPKPERGNITEILKVIDSLPAIKTPYPEMDTVELIKKTKLEYLEHKYGNFRNRKK